MNDQTQYILDPHVINAIWALIGALLAAFAAWALSLKKEDHGQRKP